MTTDNDVEVITDTGRYLDASENSDDDGAASSAAVERFPRKREREKRELSSPSSSFKMTMVPHQSFFNSISTLTETGINDGCIGNINNIESVDRGGTWGAFRESIEQQNPIKVPKRVYQSLSQVIFPTAKWIRRWDMLMLALLLLCLIIIPYELGVNYLNEKSKTRIILKEVCNTIFMIDSFLYFHRPYRGNHGKWVIDLRSIRWHYLTRMFIFDMLSVIPYTGIIYKNYNYTLSEDRESLKLRYVFMGLKLFRFLRFPQLLADSQAMVDFRMQHKSQWSLMLKYSLTLLIMAHLVACIWCMVPFLENGGNPNFGDSVNWIRVWYDSQDESVQGQPNTPNPYGIDNHLSRYIIALFWAIQTITSIGYGNISPVTLTEWCIGCVIQLIAGIGWTYFLGGFIHVVTGFEKREEEFGGRTDKANTLIRAMNEEGEGYETHGDGIGGNIFIKKTLIAKRIRSCIYDKYKLSSSSASAGDQDNANGLSDSYPVLQSLPSNLREHASILLLQKYLNHIPYLSSYYYTLSDQADICMQCVLLEFPAGEIIRTHRQGKGGGLWLVLSGCACYAKDRNNTNKHHRSVLSSGTMVGMGRVLLEDDHPFIGGRMFFLTYSRVLFIPRAAILQTLERNPTAWKQSARWIYARTLLSQSDVTQAY